MKWINNLPFKYRVFFGCLFTALVPLLLSGILTMRLFNISLNRQMTAEGQQQLQEISSRFDQLLANCLSACDSLTMDGSASWVLIDNKTVEYQKDLYLSLYQAVQELYSRTSLTVYDAGGKLRFTTSTSAKPVSLPVNWGLLKKAGRNKGVTYYRTDPYLDSTGDVVLQGVYSLENTHGARTGYVVMDFTRNDFDYLMNGFYSSGDTLLLLDSHQQPFYCSRPGYEADDISNMIERTVAGAGYSDSEEHIHNLWSQNQSREFYILLERTAPIGGPALKTMKGVSLILSFVSLLLCLLISAVLSRSISQPVSLLDKAMAKIKKGDLSIRIHTNRQDELGRLTESFSQMTEDLQNYLEDTVRKQKDLNETTLKLYQTQLNPHFLYNTLDTIKWNARINMVPEIAILAENLAVILRKSISSRPFITLKEELETIASYIEIQKIRFSGRFLYETEIPDLLESCFIPKMILQPLVENAIVHGLDGCEHGYICIYAVQKDRNLYISVTDDGCGMNEEMTEWINSEQPAKREGHLGLYNVIHILKLYYGQQYGIQAVTSPEGTTITVSLPVQKEEPHVSSDHSGR